MRPPFCGWSNLLYQSDPVGHLSPALILRAAAFRPGNASQDIFN
jgi:hypothetical protein